MTDFHYWENRFIIMICLISAGIIILGLYFPYLNFLALAVLCVAMFRLNKVDILCLLMFNLSFSTIFKINLGGFTFFNLVIVVALVRGLLINNFNIPRKSGIALILLTFYALAISFYVDLIGCVTVLSSLALAAVLYRPNEVKFSLKKIVIFTTWGILGSSGVALMGSYIPRISFLLNQTTIRLAPGKYYYRFSGLMENPNYYTMFLSLVLAAIAVLILQRKANLMDYIYFIALSVFGFMSLSQSFMITFAVIVILLGWFYMQYKPRYIFYGIMLIISILYIIYILLDKDVITTILFRITSELSSNKGFSAVTSGRTELWMYYIDYLLDNLVVLIFGAGLGAGNLWVGASHNFYIDMLYYLGIIGTFIYIFCLYKIFGTRCYCVRRAKLYQFLPLFVFLIRAFARNLILSEQLIFMLILCSVAICEGNTYLEIVYEKN